MASSHGQIEKLLLLGDKGASAQLYPVVLNKAIEFSKEVTPGAVLTKRMVFKNGWARIQLREGRRKIVIYTESGGASLEFFTSEIIHSTVMGTPPHIGSDGYNLSVCGKGSYHQFSGAGAESHPLVNLCHNCFDNPPDVPDDKPWPMENCDTNAGLKHMSTPEAWDYKKSQVQVWWSGNSGEEFVIVQSDVDSYYSRRCMQARFNGAFIFRDNEFISDGTYYPVAYTYDQGEPFAYGSPNMLEGRKRRKACIVHHEQYAIMVMVDNKGTFYAWEAGRYESPAEIPRTEIITPPYDSRIVDALGTFSFNSNGSKAVAVALERFQSPLEDGTDTVYKATIGEIEDIPYGFGRDDVDYPQGRHLATEDSPHLVEVTIGVGKDSITDEWTFSVTINRSERYGDTGKWFVAADYLIGDERLPYPKDTLVALTSSMQFDSNDANGIWDGSASPLFPDDIDCVFDTAVSTEAYFDGNWVKIHQYQMYGNVRVTPSQVPIYKDPFGNKLETWSAVQKLAGSSYLPLYSSTIRAMNLRTLSFLFLKEELRNATISPSNTARSFRSEVYAYGKLEDTKEYIDSTQGAPSFDYVWASAGRQPVPATYLALLSVFSENLYQPEWLCQFNWHPKGHWSINHFLYPVPSFELPNWQVDIVNVRNGDNDERMTHKDLYNSAFNESRDYSYYNDSAYFRGVFRTAGLWRDK